MHQGIRADGKWYADCVSVWKQLCRCFGNPDVAQAHEKWEIALHSCAVFDVSSIVTTVGRDIYIPECDEDECPIRPIWDELQQSMRSKLGEMTLSACVNHNGKVEGVLE